MIAPLGAVIVKKPQDAYRSNAEIEKEWRPLGYSRPPDLARAIQDHADFTALLERSGARVLYLPEDSRTGLDSIYTHDAALITNAGAIILQAGKPARRGESIAFHDACLEWEIPILGSVDGEASAEAGDMLWLDPVTLLVGRSFRTNNAGIRRLTVLLQPRGIGVVPVDLPCWDGPKNVLHLMSLISLLDADVAVVYRPLLPVSLLERLSAAGVRLIETPDHEYASLGTNVLAISPRNVLIAAGNPVTRSRLETAGCRVSEFDGSQICHPGAGGPTCLTRPVWRA